MNLIVFKELKAPTRTPAGIGIALASLLLATGAAAGESAQSAVAIARNSTEAVVQVDGRALVIVDANGEVLARLAQVGTLAALEVSPRGDLVAALSPDGELALWNWRSGAVARSNPFGKGAVIEQNPRDLDELHFAPDGQRLLVGVHRTRVQVVSVVGAVVGTVDGVRPLPFCASIVWDGAGERLAHVNEVGIAILDDRTLAPLQAAGGVTLGQRWTSRVECLEFHPSASHLATGHADGRIRITDVTTGTEVRVLEHVDPMYGPPLKDNEEDPLGIWPWIGWLAHSRDGTRLAYTSASGVHLGCFELESGDRIALSPYGDGRMGTPAVIRWGPRDQRVYYGIWGGERKLPWVEFGSSVRYGAIDAPGRTVPSFGAGRVGVFLDGSTLRAVDGLTGELLWSRSAKELLDAVLVAPSDAEAPR